MSLEPSRRSALALLTLPLLLLLLGCTGRERRPVSPIVEPARPAALVLDGAMAHPSAHRTLLARLAAVGLRPTYRRFDPRLGAADIERYALVVWLGERLRGSRGSLAVDRVEIERAVRFVERGGGLALGVPPGRAARGAEGRAFQAVLDRLGVPIVIEPHEVVDLAPASSYPAALFRAPLFTPDPVQADAWGLPAVVVGERAAPLRVQPGASPLLWSSPASFLDRLYGPPPADRAAFAARPVAALGTAGGGRVLVASRLLLDAGGTPVLPSAEPVLPERLPVGALAGRERLLRAVLRELAFGKAGSAPVPSLPGTPAPDVASRPGAGPGAGLGAPGGPVRRCGAWRAAETWVDREGLRIGWGYVDRPDAEVESLLDRLPASGLNVLWGPARWGGLAWPARDRAAAAVAQARLARIEARLRETGVRWLAGVEVPGRDVELARYPRAVSIGGREVALPAPVDTRFWDEQIVPQLEALAAKAGEISVLAGIVLDLEMYGQPVPYYGNAFDFGDGPFRAFLGEVREASARAGAGPSAAGVGDREAAGRLPLEVRGDWLLERGRLAEYYEWLERRAEAIGGRLRAAVDAAAPPGRDLLLGFYAVGVLPSWFYRGLWRGASAGGRPVLLLTFQDTAASDLDEEAARGGICARHAQAALLGLVGADGLAALLARAGRLHDGFWLNRLTTLVAPRGGFEAVEVPVGVSGEAAWRWVAGGVAAYLESRRVAEGGPGERAP